MKTATLPAVFAIALASTIPATASDTAAATASASAAFAERIEVSLQAYKDQSATIADEKIPLLRQINQLEDENLALREKVKFAQQATAENNTSFDALRNRLADLKSQTDFADRYLREYLDNFESRIHTAEDQHFKRELTKIRLALDQPAQPLGQRFEGQLAAIDLGLKRAEQAIGGYLFEGAAIAPNGVLRSGTIHVFGPSAFFSDVRQGGTISGMLRLHTGTIEPAIVELPPEATQQIAGFVQNRTGPLPLDPTLGHALEVENTNVRLEEHVRNGGPVGYAILLLGAVAAILSAVKIFDLRRFHSISAQRLQEIIRAARSGNEAGALTLARKVSGPVGEMLEVGVRNIRAQPALLEDMMLSVMLRRRPEVERFLSFLAVTAVASPLLGLLGTVAGMIRTFSLIVIFGTGDPRALSSGISEALITTEFGLLVAIPAVAAHGILARMVKSRLGDMERIAFEFVKNLSLEENGNGTSHPPATTTTTTTTTAVSRIGGLA